MVKNKNLPQKNITFTEQLYSDIEKQVKKYGYINFSDFVREATREKLYGKDIKEEITNEFMKQIEKEKSYIFEEKKNLHERLKKIAKRF